MAIMGGLVAFVAFGVASVALAGQFRVDDPARLLWVAAGGALLFTAGFAYVAVRQLRVRRHLPPERYRGPSVIVLLVLALAIITLITAPFTSDAVALVEGDRELSFLGAAVILVSTGAGLLLVSWLLVFRPKALEALPSLPGPNATYAIGAGVGWGLLAWLGAAVVSVAVAALLELAGLEVEPQVAEQAIAVVEPWLVILAVVILAPIAEEVFFRGVVFNAWLRERGRRWAFIGSSVMFAVIHASLVAVIPIFLLGLALAWIYQRTGNLLAPIAMHATFNAISVALALLVRFDMIRVPV